MLSITFAGNTCTIHHPHWHYQFHKDFLTPGIWNSMHRLLEKSYPLTHQQNTDLTTLFNKITNEQSSTYRYAEALQRTYLIELIHCILKLQR
jgi:hypothetical protein